MMCPGVSTSSCSHDGFLQNIYTRAEEMRRQTYCWEVYCDATKAVQHRRSDDGIVDFSGKGTSEHHTTLLVSCKVSEGIYHKPIDGNNMITLIRDSYEFVLPDINVRITTATSLEKTRVQIKASTWTATCSAFVNINEFWDLVTPEGVHDRPRGVLPSSYPQGRIR